MYLRKCLIRQALTNLKKTATGAIFMQHITTFNQRVIRFLVSYKLLCFVDGIVD